jgi:ureidoacrylate peracid hydrolase
MHNITISEEIITRVTERRGRVHLFDKIDPKKSALIIIDMQNAFCKEGAPVEVPLSRGVVPNINKLASELRKLGGDVIWIVSEFAHHRGVSEWENFFTHIVASEVRERTMRYMEPGAEGTLLWHELESNEDDIYLVKNRYSCLASSACQLERVLRSRGIETLLIAGTKTNICCETTARDAFDMDFKVVLLSDCCAALSDREHQATMESIIQQFGDVLSGDEVVERMST